MTEDTQDRETFDNIRHIYGRMAQALERIDSRIDQMDSTATGDATTGEVMGLVSEVCTFASDAFKAIISLNMMMSVVAKRLDLTWMIDGPGVDMEWFVTGKGPKPPFVP